MIMDGTFAMGADQVRQDPRARGDHRAADPELPDVPTMKEAGLDFELSPWWGVYLPAKTPTAIVEKIGDWMSEITKTEETRKFLERIAALPMHDDTKAAHARLLADIEKWGPLVKAAKIEPQ